MKRPIVIDIIAFLAMFVVSLLVSIITKGRFGEDFTVDQRVANYCIISIIVFMVVTVNKFFIKYTIPVYSPINLSIGFAIITAFATTVSLALAIGIIIAGAVCLWVCVFFDEEIVHKQLFVIDAVIMYLLVLGVLYSIPKYIHKYISF